MALIKSISGIRGTIGGVPGSNLTPVDIVSSAAAFGQWIKSRHHDPTLVIGRDARISGEIVSHLVVNTIRALGIHVIDLGLSTTPTVEVMVTTLNAHGGIILTASHNPRQWNALKLLNEAGEFISAADGAKVLELAENAAIEFADVDHLGTYTTRFDAIQHHIDTILRLPLVQSQVVKEKQFKVVVDGINSTGAIAIPMLLEALGCQVVVINQEMHGNFAHNPEPLPEHLAELSQAVLFHKAHLGIVVDPDVDRLAFVSEDGEFFGEEYTLVAVADYVLGKTPGNTVSNLSSTRALRDVTEKHGHQYHAAAVGEVNVVNKMKAVNAVIGGEGNGGVIYPALHYGRDAMAGVALFLSFLAQSGKSVSTLRAQYPNYIISKNKIELAPGTDMGWILSSLADRYARQPLNQEDGLRIEFDQEWVHLRQSNTEPIIRIYSESQSETVANNLARKIMTDIQELLEQKRVEKLQD